MPLTDEQKARRAELERELNALRAQDDERALTIAEVKAMSKEEVEREWERVRQAIATAPADAAEEPTGVQRLASAKRLTGYPNQEGGHDGE